jgi:pimeloyl-ACP methyl ester carboxylesterase/ketosteroid isomerase-like protein
MRAMRRFAVLLATLFLTMPLLADAVEEIRQAETGFAKAFADRDKAAFFAYVAPDAVFMNALGTLRGKEQIVARWSRFFDGVPQAPFSWGPERVEITDGGRTGFSMGPLFDPAGQHAGYYSSIWQKQADGKWLVVFDGPGNPPAPVGDNVAPVEEGVVTTADGVGLHYRKIGAGPVKIIAPLGTMLETPLSQFADIATVITYDPRNRGRSSKVADASKLSIERDVDDLEAIRAHVKAEKFVPVGFSYLGKMVMLYAAAHPEHVSRVIQLGPVANEPLPPAQPEDGGVPAADVKKLDELKAADAASKQPAEYCEAWLGVFRYQLVGDPAHASRIDPKEGCRYELEWPKNTDRHFAAIFPSILASRVSAEQLKKITMPVLTIHGTKDRNASYAGGRAWVASLPNARLVSVPGAAHAVWLDDPIAVFGAIRHFLRGEWPLGSEPVAE